MQEFSRQLRSGGLSVGLVPTMGYLHEGHLELVRTAKELCEVVVVSIFVNPTQFNDPEDFANYPRDDKTDLALLEHEGVDLVFKPRAEEVYVDGAATSVRVKGLSEGLCGPGRPGHFEGVATVVAALLNMVAPDVAVFGSKDYQQLQIIRRLVADLHFPVRIVAGETVREPDGLAMSSRNARLSAKERAQAPAVYRGLCDAAEAFNAGETRSSALLEAARRRIVESAAIELEYLELVDGQTLEPQAAAYDGCVVAVAVRLGAVRLIDNVELSRGCPDHTLLGREDIHA